MLLKVLFFLFKEEEIVLPQAVQEFVVSEFYDEAIHDGLFIFGSAAKDWTEQSDIDVLVITSNSKTFKHHLKRKKGFLFDVFEMPVEYAFYQIRTRDQMWLYAFAMAKHLAGERELNIIKQLSSDILATEPYVVSGDELERLFFGIDYRLKKLKRYQNSPHNFKFLSVDFIDKLNHVLHVVHQKWPGVGSRVNKIERLLNDFPEFSSELKKLVDSKSNTHFIDTAARIVERLITPPSSKDVLIVQELNVSGAIKQMEEKL